METIRKPFITTLEAAVAHLIGEGRIRKDIDIVNEMRAQGSKISKGTFSSFKSGQAALSKNFVSDFETLYQLKLDDFANQINQPYMTKNKNAPEQSEAEPRIMREFLDFLKHQNRDLVSLMPAITTHLASITTNLSSVTVNLKNMEAREAKIEAYAKTILQYAAEVASGGDPEKTQLAMNKLSNLVEVNTMEPIVSNRSSAENKQSKA